MGSNYSHLASISLLGFTIYLVSSGFSEVFSVSWEWLQFGDHSFELGFFFDDVTATMLSMIAIVGLCITIFSLGYIASDPAKGRFFGGLSFFMFSMLGIVLADNLIMIFVFWELVGFSSYMLIGHYYQNQDTPDWHLKKLSLLIEWGILVFFIGGILLTYWQFGTTNIASISAAVGVEPSLVNTLVGALLICGFIGKSINSLSMFGFQMQWLGQRRSQHLFTLPPWLLLEFIY